MRGAADRVRGARPERQADAGRTAARSSGRGGPPRTAALVSRLRHAIGTEIGRALQGDRDYGPDVMQLLYVANRYEWKPQMEFELGRGTVLICDRYLASSIAYGEAQGLEPAWLAEMQKHLPQPDITFLLDINPDVSARRKTADRDKYERDLALLGRVRASYMRQAQPPAGRRSTPIASARQLPRMSGRS